MSEDVKVDRARLLRVQRLLALGVSPFEHLTRVDPGVLERRRRLVAIREAALRAAENGGTYAEELATR